MKCTKCGTDNGEMMRFCTVCGTPLTIPSQLISEGVVPSTSGLNRESGTLPLTEQRAPKSQSGSMPNPALSRGMLLANIVTCAEAGYRMVACQEGVVQMVKAKRYDRAAGFLFFLIGPFVSGLFLPFVPVLGTLGLAACGLFGIATLISYLGANDRHVLFYIDATGKVNAVER